MYSLQANKNQQHTLQLEAASMLQACLQQKQFSTSIQVAVSEKNAMQLHTLLQEKNVKSIFVLMSLIIVCNDMPWTTDTL